MTNDIPEQACPKKLVLSLIRRSNEAKTRVQSINGEIGQEVKEAVENKHLHAGALKVVAKLVRMDSEKRDDFLRAFQLYSLYAIEGGLFGDEYAGDLVDDAEAGEPAEGAASLGDVVAGNVRKLRRGIKKTAAAGDDGQPPMAN